jgi:hypothetical protein
VFEQRWKMIQLLEESVDSRMKTAENFRTEKVQMKQYGLAELSGLRKEEQQ